jgi:predicted unusual protein kinase regulating ubiquinone biosynthesis (AarF/ABC1/UbiB family)
MNFLKFVAQKILRYFPVVTKLLQIVVQTANAHEYKWILDQVGTGTFSPDEYKKMVSVIKSRFPDMNPVELHMIGCGTIGCVFKYKDLALKVKIPGIVERITRDVDTLIIFAWWFDVITFNFIRLHRRVKTFRATIHEQYDFELEQVNCEIFTCNLVEYGYKHIRVPKIHKELCTEDLLVFDLVEGQPLSRRPSSLQAVSSRKELMDEMTKLCVHNITTFDIFHLDMHMGNILFDGKFLYVIDFGMCIPKLAQKQMIFLGRMIRYVFKRDALKLARTLAQEYFLDHNCTISVITNDDIRKDFEYYVTRELHLNYDEPFDVILRKLFEVGANLSRKYDTFGTLDMGLVEIGATQTLGNLIALGVNLSEFERVAYETTRKQEL